MYTLYTCQEVYWLKKISKNKPETKIVGHKNSKLSVYKIWSNNKAINV